MSIFKFILILGSLLSAFRATFRIFGQDRADYSTLLRVFPSILVIICSWEVTRHPFLLFLFVFLIAMVGVKLIKYVKGHQNEAPLETYLDQIVLIMKSGVGYETACRQVAGDFSCWHRLFLLSDNENNLELDLTNDQRERHRDLLRVFFFCRKNPSQSYRVIFTLRQMERLRVRLLLKQSSLTLQAKAQAAICLALFGLILGFQWAFNPDFIEFIKTPWGRSLLAIGAGLVGSGIWQVHRMAKPREIEI